MYIKQKTLRENYKEVYKLWRERNPVTRMNIDAKTLLNQKNYILQKTAILGTSHIIRKVLQCEA